MTIDCRSWLIAMLCVPLVHGANAENAPKATIQVQCAGGEKNAQVAIRWASPNHDSANNILHVPVFKVKCGDSQQPMQAQSTTTTLPYPNSELEIQTEGGVMTSYVAQIIVDSQKPNLKNTLVVEHSGSPSVAYTGAGFQMSRSSGPNKYGEQNFRVTLTNPASAKAHVKIVAQSKGDRSDAQMALRWGHPDFNKTSYFPLWTIKPGAAQTKAFTLTNAKSEFEIQTEGGTGTGYNLQIYVDVGQGMPTQPSILIAYNKPTTDFENGYTDISFSEPNGNIYGEMNIKVEAPWIVPPAAPTSALGGLNVVYDYGTPSPTPPTSNATIRFLGNWIAGSAPLVAGGRTTYSQDVNETVNGGEDNLFSHSEGNLQPGNWSVQAVPVIGGQLGIVSGCNRVVTAGAAPIITISTQTHGCR